MHKPEIASDARAVELSIVTTLYRSRDFLDEFIEECLDAVAAIGNPDFELVFVNDGSPDDSREHVLERQKSLPNLVLIDLSRNFGHHHAAQAGLLHARGALIFLIDCDLEVSPKVLVGFRQVLQEHDCDVVYGFQDQRKGRPLERIAGAVFWRVLNWLSDIEVPRNIVTERLMTRRYVDAVLRLGDRNLFMAGMMAWAGFEQIGMPVEKRQRSGASTYGLIRRMALMVDAISSFSARPLYWLFGGGICITGLSFAYLLYLLGRKLIFGDTILGFTSIMGMMSLTLGILTMSLGLIGIYLAKVFRQVQGRPNHIVRRISR